MPGMNFLAVSLRFAFSDVLQKTRLLPGLYFFKLNTTLDDKCAINHRVSERITRCSE
jgi:hypothetical protein